MELEQLFARVQCLVIFVLLVELAKSSQLTFENGGHDNRVRISFPIKFDISHSFWEDSAFETPHNARCNK
jgi:hypothetical protein